MKCDEVRDLLVQLRDHGPVTPIPQADLGYLVSSGYVSSMTQDGYKAAVADLARMQQLLLQEGTERGQAEQAEYAEDADEKKQHSIVFHFEGGQARDSLLQKSQADQDAAARAKSQLGATEADINALLQRKTDVDGAVPFGDGYLSMTGLGLATLGDLDVRFYRSSGEEFADFVAETKATDAELQSIAERAKTLYGMIGPYVTQEAVDDLTGTSSLVWSVSIGLAKLQGDYNQVGTRFVQSLAWMGRTDSTVPNQLMAAEILTAMSGQDLQSLLSSVLTLCNEVRSAGVPKQLSAGVAATLLAGRRYDGSVPMDSFNQYRQLTKSYEAASILAVTDVPYPQLGSKFQDFRTMLTSWGYTTSEDTEISSAFLATGPLSRDEVSDKLKDIVEQLKNYLEYPLVASAILASVPVYESHEVLDLMEKAVAILSPYGAGMERSELVALAVRMVHGVSAAKQIDPTAPAAPKPPVQFSYGPIAPGFFWYYPLVVALSSYHATFSGMGGFHPAHSHGIGGFAG